MEEWRKVAGADNYEVSNLGRVRNVGRQLKRVNPRFPDHSQTVNIKPKVLKGWLRRRKGKPMAVFVALRINNQTHVRRVHHLVLGAFVGPCPPGLEGCHNDGNPLNNELSNLRWDTHGNNWKDMLTHGTYSPPPRHYGEDHHAVKFGDDVVRMIRERKHWPQGSIKKLADSLGVHPVTITRIRRGESRPGV